MMKDKAKGTTPQHPINAETDPTCEMDLDALRQQQENEFKSDPRADTPRETIRKSHTHCQQGGIILHCNDSDCEENSQQEEVEATKYEAESNHRAATKLPEAVPESANSSSGFDRHHNEILRSMHPLRKEIVGASDNICLESEHSSVQGINTTQPATSPWITNDGKLLEGKKPIKADLILPQPQVHVENNVLQLEESDYTPLSLGWGFSLLGFFAERFPGKDAVQNLIRRWKYPARASFHPKGWIIFRFEAEEQAQTVLNGGPYSVFGIHLILCSMPSEFRFDSSPALNFKVWATLPNLPLELWNASAISKIAATIGTPLEVDPQTICKNHIAGPRVLILIDASKEPPKSITLKLHNGNTFEQSILLDFYPFFCNQCRRAGHLASSCRALERANPGTRIPTCTQFKPLADQEGWQHVQRKNARYGRSRSRNPTNRPPSRAPSKAQPRSKSRPPKQQWQPKIQDQQAAATPRNTDKQPHKTFNTHIYFDSPVSEHNGLNLSNQFQPFDDVDDLEQEEDALNLMQQNSKASDSTPKHHLHQDIGQAGMGAAPAPPQTERVATTPPRYIPPPVRHDNTVLLRANSSDTLSTECIPVGSKEADRNNNNNKGKEQMTDATHTPATHEKQGAPPSFVHILTSPPNIDVNAEAQKNINKLRMETKMLDPRDAYKKKSNTLVPPSMAAAGRVLTRQNTARRK